MAGEEPKAASKKRVVESLGWLTESTIMPRKHREIEGVGASSILELKAQLYMSQEESKRHPKEPLHSADHQYAQHLEVHRAKKKISGDDSFSHKNSGVDARAAKYVSLLILFHWNSIIIVWNLPWYAMMVTIISFIGLFITSWGVYVRMIRILGFSSICYLWYTLNE